MTQKSEKLASLEAMDNVDDNTVQAAEKELQEAIVSFLRHRQEWLRIISYLEFKLEGKAKEVEVLQHYNASMPRLYGKKRSREADEVVIAHDSTVNVVSTSSDGQ